MDFPSLEEKIASFRQLEDLRHDDDNEKDELNKEEQIHRQRCRAFRHTASATRSVHPSKGTKTPSHQPQQTHSEPVPGRDSNDVEIIAVTPNLAGRTTRTSRTNAVAPSQESTTIPDTMRQREKRPSHRAAFPPPTANDSESADLSSPTVSMSKRKRSQPLKMAPDAQQIFKGLSFFYIPNDDVHPARKRKIMKALEHGAYWTRVLDDATHLVVDENLAYDNIKATLDQDPNHALKFLVNEHYPIACIEHNKVLDLGQSVEQAKYRVPGVPRKAEIPEPPQPASEASDRSLQIKPRRKDTSKLASNTSQSEISSQEGPRASPISRSAQVPEADKAGEPPKPVPEDGITHFPTENQGQNLSSTVIEDELSQCISEIQRNPKSHDEAASSDSGSDNEDGCHERGVAHENHGQSSPYADSSVEEPKPKKRAVEQNQPPMKLSKEWQDKFNCMQGGTNGSPSKNPNAETITRLEEWMEIRKGQGMEWNVYSHRRAITSLRNHPTKITTAREAQELPFIGKEIAAKIEELVNTGSLRHLEAAHDDPDHQALSLFQNIYDVGSHVARKWVESGFRTLEDLKSGANLSANQRIGVEHYDDLQLRIPRWEIEALGDRVKRQASLLDLEVEVIIGGSYRRGAKDSGDIDLIVTKPGTTSSQELTGFLNKLVHTLTADGFFTASLSYHRDKTRDGGSKWLGCCVLPRADYKGPDDKYRPIWRRIDILLVPESEMGAALIYFTGNDLFNRSMRLLARKKGLKLNQKFLSGPGVFEGRDEKKIFEILGVHWRDPHERWCS
ncbi:hypothetical protein F4780DRAFT_733609 [Xylariomycetidae sp. FL0641]|nr:hypothetical protein F4780DRAFT_733609 [Xylariomycetidae sp. FL0641]